MKKLLLTSVFSLSICVLFAQLITYTAKDTVPVYTDYFRPGANMGYFPPYSDEDLSNIAAGNPALGIPGAGIKTMRPGMYDEFTSVWGYDARINTYQHFDNVGLKDLTMIVGFPADWHREHWVHCSDGVTESEVFANIYLPVWDNGENGTPYNDDNYYAAYLYEVVSRYKDYIKFWEIWNEPGLDYTGARGWLPEGAEGNWWENDPDPCDYKLRAPIQFYIRILRMSWEIIKTLAPDDYVVVAGVGYPSFLDAVLRNTDNLDGGKISPDHPHRGGAYFDVMGFHSYPDIDGSVRYWSNEIFDFVYTRHSDAAVTGIETRKNNYQAVLDEYGYDGITYPEKEWIITEINVPRRAWKADGMGGQEVQLNYIIKTFVKAMQNDIRQMHVYNLVDIEKEADAGYEYDLMGLYKNIEDTQPYSSLQINPEGIAYKSASDALFETRYDALRTAAMNLSDDMDGGAFRHEDGKYTYVVWAKTTLDLSEEASASYSFPPAWGIASLSKTEWDHSQTNDNEDIGSQDITLTGRPVFLKETEIVNVPLTAGFNTNISSGCGPLSVEFTDASLPNVSSWEWSFPGGNPANSTAQNPQVTYDTPGIYDVSLLISNELESASITQPMMIEVADQPTVNFTLTSDVSTVTFDNASANATSYLWNFGDGNTSTEANPIHTYAADGTYTVSLIGTNNCGSLAVSEVVQIQSVFAPEAAFTASTSFGCAPLEVQFTDTSLNDPDEWLWLFSGGAPTTSGEASPTVTFTEAGIYTVILQATNSAGNNTLIQEAFIEVVDSPVVGFSYTVDGAIAAMINTSTQSENYVWDFGDGTFSTESNPVHEYAADGVYTVTLTIEGNCGLVTSTQEIIIAGSALPTAAFSYTNNSGCAPLEVQFTDESTANPSSWSWVFQGGTPSVSVDPNPVITYSTPGTYEVTLFVSNSSGNNVLTQNIIEVAEAPIANFTTTIQSNQVSFNNQSTTGATYLWDFGDGSTSTLSNPSHTYAGNGTYTVTLTVENVCGTIINMQEIDILGAAAPIASFSFDVDTGCAPLEVQFTDESSLNPSSWSWIFEGGTPASSMEQNPIISYDTPGVYEVTLFVSNAGGTDVAALSSVIEVIDNPTANFAMDMQNNDLSFNNLSLNATSYLWNFGDGNTSTEENPSHTYAMDGDYTVSLLVENICGTANWSQDIIVSGSMAPEAAFSVDVSTGCAPLAVQFTDASTANPENWLWVFEGGTPANSTERNPIVTYNTPGLYEVTLSVSNGAGTDVVAQSTMIEVYTEPIAFFTSFVLGDSVIFNNLSTTQSNYLWDFGDGTTSELLHPTHTFPSDGIYDVSLMVENPCGDSTIVQTIQITGSSAPNAAFSADANTGCGPLEVQFMDQSTLSPTSWSWLFEGGTPAASNEENPIVSYATPGTYEVTLFVSNPSGSDFTTQASYITVLEAPTASFDYTINGDTIFFTNTTGAVDNIIWDFGDLESSTEENPWHVYSESGLYDVMIFVSNECGADNYMENINLQLTNTADLALDQAFNLYPNPNSGAFTILLENEKVEEIDLSFYNIVGQRLHQETLKKNRQRLVHDLRFTDLPNGTYFVQLKTKDATATRRVVVKR